MCLHTNFHNRQPLKSTARNVLNACIDSNASNAYFPIMSTTLTIRNLDPEVKRKLRLQAAAHNTSMEAEARTLLTHAVEEPKSFNPPRSAEELKARLLSVRGIWRDQGTTDDLMQLTRGED